MNVGLDVGSGFVKVVGNGKRTTFPSLYSCGFADVGSFQDTKKESFQENVGAKAFEMGRMRNNILVRPVDHGLPANDAGFLALVKKAFDVIGIRTYADANVAVGITYEASKHRKKVHKLVAAGTGASCVVVPQAYGTLVAAGKKYGTVVNIGHGTTEILSITHTGREGKSVKMAGDYITSQLDARKGMYIHHDRLFKENKTKTARLVGLLAMHLADDISRISEADNVILSGGGSLIPGIREALEKATGIKMNIPENPSFSNAMGLEMVATRHFGGGKK